jgi:RNA polymerase sigma factor (sigma-70 family)
MPARRDGFGGSSSLSQGLRSGVIQMGGPMRPDESKADWLSELKRGDPEGAQQLWEEYFERLVGFAQKRLQAAPRRVVDPEDVALSAINSFCQNAAQGKFPQLEDRDDLWRILVTITARKALRQAQHARRRKRGGGKVRGESVFAQADSSQACLGIGQIVGREPTPAFAAELADQMQHLLNRLDDNLRRLAVLKMQGYTNQEIAEILGCALRSVERKLHGIRVLWSHPEEP